MTDHVAPELRVIGLEGIPEIRPGDDLPALISQAARSQSLELQAGDILVVTQKIVSKAEGRLVRLHEITPSPFAIQFAEANDRDPRQTEMVLRESRRIVRMDRGVLITETHHGFICASSGVDASNIAEAEEVSLLPVDPDLSAKTISEGLHKILGVEVPVIISDTFGRPWREGLTEVAIGVAGLNPLQDYRGLPDVYGRPMQVTLIAVADELASCAGLVTTKVNQVPVAVIRGYPFVPAPGSGQALLRDPSIDMFR